MPYSRNLPFQNRASREGKKIFTRPRDIFVISNSDKYHRKTNEYTGHTFSRRKTNNEIFPAIRLAKEKPFSQSSVRIFEGRKCESPEGLLSIRKQLRRIISFVRVIVSIRMIPEWKFGENLENRLETIIFRIIFFDVSF